MSRRLLSIEMTAPQQGRDMKRDYALLVEGTPISNQFVVTTNKLSYRRGLPCHQGNTHRTVLRISPTKLSALKKIACCLHCLWKPAVFATTAGCTSTCK
jgi:hypothetical protein